MNDNITTALFWEYDSRIGRRWNIDPKLIVGNSPYSVFVNNPNLNPDFNGDSTQSTHTDKNGKVIAVFNDNDLGIYKHEDLTSKSEVVQAIKKTGSTSGGGSKQGETLIWDSFVNEYGNPAGKITFGSYDGRDWMYKALSEIKGIKMNDQTQIVLYALNAGGGDRYDYKTNGINKVPKSLKNDHLYRGSQLSDRLYLSARDFGNYFAGKVASATSQKKI